MQTRLLAEISSTPQGQEADRILRACVHCGFCTATCPTYQLLGDELDSPRGRIYLIKQMLEGNQVSRKTMLHLDRCLTCRACETTCPSGVQYGKLIDIGRDIAEHHISRRFVEKITRFGLRILVPYPSRFRALLRLAGLFKPLMPRTLKQKVPVIPTTSPRSTTPHPRRMLILEGCAQSVTTPRTNEAAARTLDKLGIEVISAPSAGCCGAVSQHLSAHEEALEFVRRNIDAWWPYVEQGAEAIIITASGCGVMVKDYGELLKHDPVYSSKAQRIASLARDISEILAAENLVALRHTPARKVVAFHCPCTLQHGQKLNGAVEKLLQEFGYTTVPVADSHLCCGSAGTYSVLQPDLAQQLLDNKLAALQRETPELIATANVGCQMHLATKAKIPVQHWVELINETLT